MYILLFVRKTLANVWPFYTPVTNIFVDFGNSTKLDWGKAKVQIKS